MMPGMNPRKVQQMMKQMGIQQVDVPAIEVIIKTEDKEIIISEPSVQKVNMMGQENFQISGNVTERDLSTTPDILEDDVKTVMEQAGVNEDAARDAIEKAEGDLAEAILNFSKQEEDNSE